jgi:uncharacterized protein YndB with AHSA1/START domain
VRYSDSPSVEVDIHIEAGPDRVWPLITDINLPARFSTEFQGARWLDDSTGAAEGARFAGRNMHQATGEWETTCTVTACEAGRLFAWAVGDPAFPSASWSFEVEPDGGGSRLRQRAQMGPAIEAMPDKEERIVARRLAEFETNMLATLEGIKALAEASESAGSAESR